MEYLRFYNCRTTALTGDDKKNVINLYSMFANKKRQQKSITTVKDIKKYATDVLGNLYEVKYNKLKLEFK